MAKVGRLVKESMVQEITSTLSERPSFLVTSLGRIEAIELDTLRKQLRTMQARVLMTKRTLGLRSVSGLALSDLPALFQGSVALVFPGEDIVPAAKLLVDFAKANQEKLSVRGGFVEGQLLNSKRVEELAALPSKPQLLAELVGVLEAPATDLILTLEQVIGDVAWVLEAASKAAPAAPAPTTTTAQTEAPAQPDAGASPTA
ncbi:MAG: 50S ribosomal protein L10 [Candidatus Omnitrophica bacterium]|nr:50S ribosomal protein L10 [Candidatus Omnitrophota bacterium]